MGRVKRWPVLVLGLIVLALSVLLTLRDPMYPAGGLDGSWQLATEYAAKHGLVFGRDYVFTYGPFHYLATRLFDPATWPWVLVSEAISVAAMFWAALRNRSLAAILALFVCVVLLQMQFDSLSVLALYGVFLICLQSRGYWPLAAMVLCAPLVLAKLSFGLVLLPLVLLADLDRLIARRPPVLTLALLVSCLAAYLLVGQPIGGLWGFLSGGLETILGYGRAMQWPGSRHELLSTVALTGAALAAAAATALNAWRDDSRDLRPPLAVLGLAWVLFAVFKFGFVRQDPHTLIYHLAAPAAVAMALGFLDRPDAGLRRSRAILGLVLLALLGSSLYWRSYQMRPGQAGPAPLARDVGQAVGGLGSRLRTGMDWATGRRFAVTRQVRGQTEAAIRRSFPATVTGTVDAIPWDAAPLIVSGLDYRPRPALQSYSAYTAGLQRRDLAHFSGPNAPETLILRVEDVDLRLPSLGVGPSLAVIGRRYDAVGDDPLGLVLKRRATPRPAVSRVTAEQRFPLETWIPAPGGPGRLVMARIKVHRSLAGRLVGLAYREPVMGIHLRTASGRELPFRFVPGMAELGVAISPLPASWAQGAPVLLDPSWSIFGEPVTAIRLVTAGKGWAFSDASVAFEEITYAPGFAAAIRGLALVGGQLAASDPQRAATFNGSEIFAHAATTIGTTFDAPARLRGVAGLHPQPPGTPPGDGVRFIAILTPAGGAPRVVLDTQIAASGPPVPFDIQAPAGARLELKTLPVGNTNYDWSYWGKLELMR